MCMFQWLKITKLDDDYKRHLKAKMKNLISFLTWFFDKYNKNTDKQDAISKRKVMSNKSLENITKKIITGSGLFALDSSVIILKLFSSIMGE